MKKRFNDNVVAGVLLIKKEISQFTQIVARQFN